MFVFIRKITELDEELKIVTNNMKSLEIAEQEVTRILSAYVTMSPRSTQPSIPPG